MGDTLARIFEYRVLHAKSRELQIPLSPEEQQRFGALRRELPAHVPTVDDQDVFTALNEPLPAQFVAGGRFASGILRNCTAIGLAIETLDDPPALGQRLILHVQEPEHGVEYTFPCRVIARVVVGLPSMGVVFDGVPSETRSRARTSGVFAPEPPQLEQDEIDTAKVSRI